MFYKTYCLILFKFINPTLQISTFLVKKSSILLITLNPIRSFYMLDVNYECLKITQLILQRSYFF